MRALALVALSTLLALAAPAAAHDHLEVLGKYELTVGFATEPAIVDEPNGVLLRIAGPKVPVDSATINVGATFSHVVREEGVFAYRCDIHPSMRGNVTVSGSGPATTRDVEIKALQFVPKSIAAKVGDTILWHNNDTAPHTVTEVDAAAHEGDGHDHSRDGARMVPVTGAEKDLKVTVSTGGREITRNLEPAPREPGAYVAPFIPTVAGVYTFHFKGKIGGDVIDKRHEYASEPVQERDAFEFPERTIDNLDTKRKLDDQASKLRDASNATGGNAAPGAGAVAALALLALAGLLARRR